MAKLTEIPNNYEIIIHTSLSFSEEKKLVSISIPRALRNLARARGHTLLLKSYLGPDHVLLVQL